MILRGKPLAEKIYAELPRLPLRLGILVGETTPVIESFVSIKQKTAERLGVTLVRRSLGSDPRQSVRELAAETDGVIVQLPLPPSIPVDAVLAAIPADKDVDGISPEARVLPPVAGALAAILDHEHITVAGQPAVVVGSGRLVGRPVATLLRDRGAIVTVVTKGDSLVSLKDARIVVLGAGEPGLVKPEHLTEGVVLIDAGTSEDGGKVAGDAHPSCAEVASLFTPVPGGVGPIAVAMIFKNLHTLAQKRGGTR